MIITACRVSKNPQAGERSGKGYTEDTYEEIPVSK
jgi:hypothetical protein